jgi:hypothetical protein
MLKHYVKAVLALVLVLERKQLVQSSRQSIIYFAPAKICFRAWIEVTGMAGRRETSLASEAPYQSLKLLKMYEL